jgi:hypothetical protein
MDPAEYLDLVHQARAEGREDIMAALRQQREDLVSQICESSKQNVIKCVLDQIIASIENEYQ